MKLIIRTCLVLALLSLSVLVVAQDSLRVFSYEEFIEIVRAHHPVSKQADLNLEEGNSALLKARGGFDPMAFTTYRQKQFEDTEYYDLFNGGFKFPTWLGVDLEAGYEQSAGTYLNPESTTPDNGLFYAGLSVPIGQGLIIDKRRAELQKARTYQMLTEVERQALYNDLIYNAGKAYWEWYVSYNVLKVYEEALSLAAERREAIKSEALTGNRPAIDTLEAGIQVQNRRIAYDQASLDFENSSVYLSIFLWADGMIPLELNNDIVPFNFEKTLQSLEIDDYDFTEIIDEHPILLGYQFDIDILETDRRLKKEQIKPVLNLKYNALAQGSSGGMETFYSTNNYTFGMEFRMPLFLRKERGDLRLADLKVQQKQIDFIGKRADLGFKVQSALNELSTSYNQIETSSRIVEDYRNLLNGEIQMFETGESSLFMINSREIGFISAQVKLIEFIGKYKKAEIASRYAAGILYQNELN